MTFCLMIVEMEDDSDIYSDLPVCNFDDEIEKLKASNKNLSVEIAHLQEELLKITKQKDEYQTKCATLTKNISSLLKTAQAEIQRKDKLIKELRDQITETQSYRKRKIQKDSDTCEVPLIKRSTNCLVEEQNSARKDSVYKENGLSASENKSLSTCNDNLVDNLKQDPSAINKEISLLRQNSQRLPFANVQCKTIYSQRMLSKLQTLSKTNQSSDIQSKTDNGKGSHDNYNGTQRNDSYESPKVKETVNDNPKGNEEQKFVEDRMKSDTISESPFLVPEVNGINKLSSTTLSTDKKEVEANLEPKNVESINSMRSKQVEVLFGSPLKWTENSNETIPQLAPNSPTVYEDSCSAHIENAKFTLDLNKSSLSRPISINKDPVQKITPINKSACIVERPQVNENVPEKEKSMSNESRWVRAFEHVSNKGVNKPKSIFSGLKKDSNKFSSLSVNINKECSVDVPHNFLLKSKYEDSVLGQFDDTTQFVSALTRVESKISPLNTPVKSSSQTLSVNISTSSVKSNSIKEEIVPEQLTRPADSSQVTNANSRPVNKDIHEKPINILQPRKTPRIVNYNKSKEIDKKASTAATETPTKFNRFAISEEFICKQEEKVLKKCLTNVKDPIAISISSKSKAKDSHSPKGRTLRLSPKGKQKNLSYISKQKKTKVTISPVESKINATKKPDEREINDSEKIVDFNTNLQHTSKENAQTFNQAVPNGRSKEIFEKSLSKSRLNVQENPSNLHGSNEKLNKQYWSSQENLPIKESVDKDQAKSHQSSITENSSNLRRSREKQVYELTHSKLENASNTSRSQEKLVPKLDGCRKSSEKYLATSQQSNQKSSFNLSRSVEKNMPHSSVESSNLQKVHESSLKNVSNLGRSHETRQSRSNFSPNQEKSTKEHQSSEKQPGSTYLNQTSDEMSSNYFQNTREKQSKRKMIDRIPSPEINPTKFNKRYDEKQQMNTGDSKRKERQQTSIDEALPNLCQDSVKKKFNVVPNILEKRISRIQNFKPSSQLKKQSDTSLPKEKCYQNKGKNIIDDDHKSPKNFKSNGGNCLLMESSPVMKTEKSQMTTDDRGKVTHKSLERLPTIVRSSKKPEFASTTLSDDDYASRTPTKPAETSTKNRNSEVTELMEWVLKPITFHSDSKSVKEQINQRTSRDIQSCSNKSNLKGKPHSDSETSKISNNKTDSLVSKTYPNQIKVENSAPSPNKVIRGRRPLNFGVSVVTH